MSSVLLRALGVLFVIASAGAMLAVALLGRSSVHVAVTTGVGVSRAVQFAVPILLFLLGMRTERRSILRRAALATVIVWTLGLVASMPGGNVSFGVAVLYSAGRVLALAGVALVPLLAAARRVVPRWPALAAIALAGGDAVRQVGIARFTQAIPPLFEPSPTTLVLFALLAYGALLAAREMNDESIDARADRFPPKAEPLFATRGDRTAFLGPVRLATDALLALTIVTFVATTTTVAYSLSFRLDAPPAGAEASALVLLFAGALGWLRRSTGEISYAPIVAAVAATAVSAFSTMFMVGAAASASLLLLSIAAIGFAVVAPRTKDPSGHTMRRWVSFMSAAGVMLGSAGFFVVTATAQGEPFLARLAKLVAVVFGVLAANAARRIELHARVELAAEDQGP